MTVPRFEPQLTTNFRSLPAFTPQSSSPSLVTELSETLGSVANFAVRMHGQRVRAEAGIAGQQAGAQEGFNPASLPAPVTVADRAYRAGALQSYGAQLDTGLFNALNTSLTDYQSKPEAQRNPVALAASLNTYVDETSKNLPPELKANYARLAAMRVAPVISRATSQHVSFEHQQNVAETEAAINVLGSELMTRPELVYPQTDEDYLAQDSAMARLASLIEQHPTWTDSQKMQAGLRLAGQREKAVAQAQLQHITQGIYTEFEAANNKAEFYSEFVNGGYSQRGLSFDEGLSVANKLEARQKDIDDAAKGLIPQLSWEQQYQYSYDDALLRDKIKNNTATYDDVQQHLNKWGQKVGAETAAQFNASITTNREAKRRQQEQFNTIVAGSGPITNDESRLINDRFEAMWLQGEWQSPVGQGAPVTGQFGESRPGHQHSGIDYALSKGSPALASSAGTVTFAGERGGYGNLVVIDHGNGIETYYAHASKLNVKQGDVVEAGQQVIEIGSTGNSTGPHLHYEVRRNGQPINPATYQPMQVDKEQLVNTMEQVAIDRRHVVPVYREYLQGQLNSRNWEEQVNAAQRFGRLERAGIKTGLEERDRIRAGTIAQYLRQGMSGQDAVQLAQERLDYKAITSITNNPDLLKQLKDDAQNQVEKIFVQNEWFFNGPKQTPAIPMMGGFRQRLESQWWNTLERYYVQTNQNAELARSMAKKELMETYGVSRVVGSEGQVMLYPPEQAYPLYGNADKDAEWIRNQLIKDTNKTAIGLDITPDSIMLIADETTRATGAVGQPLYRVWAKDGNGVLQLLMGDDGAPLRWSPDPEGEINSQRQQRLANEKKQIDKAAALRKKVADGQPLRGGVNNFTPLGVLPIGGF